MHSGHSKLGQMPSPQTKVPHVVFYVNKVDEMLFGALFFDKKN